MPEARKQLVDQFVARAPAAQRSTLVELRRMIRQHLPHAEETLGSSGFPVYTVGGSGMAGFSSRKKGPMLYVMAPGVLDAFADRLGRLRSGRSCVEWRETADMTLDRLRQLAGEILDRVAAENPATDSAT